MERQAENLIELLRCLASGETPIASELNVSAVSFLAYQHGISNLLYPMYRLLPKNLQPDAAVLKSCKQITYAAAIRSELQQKELNALCSAFSEQSIPVLPLKGAIIKALYTKPEYRSMSDIDLLLPLQKRAEIRQILEQMGYSLQNCGQIDTDVYISSDGLIFELHFDLTEEAPTPETVVFLRSLLERAKPENNKLTLSPEEQYVYVLAHMGKHLLSGGSGIRHVMDVWVCCHRQNMDRTKLSALLKETGLQKLASAAETLADAWFSKAPSNPLSEKFGESILSGKLFGTDQQRTENRMIKASGNRMAYWLHRVFPNYRTMCRFFPVLKKLPILLPAFWFFRFFRGLFFGRERLYKEYMTVRDLSDDAVADKESLLAQCGLTVRPNEEVTNK